MIKAAIVGATGYAGAMLTSLLSSHPEVEITSLTSHSYAGKPFSSIYPSFKGVVDNILEEDNAKAASESADVLFFCLPAGLASDAVDEEMLKKCKVIDLGADFRFSNVNTYKDWYKKDHGHPELLEKAVYGLPEIHRAEIKGSSLIGNPGCYTTCSILSLYPLVKEKLINLDSIIIDAKSGVSGAGRSEKIASLFCECNESIKPYGVKNHRHTPEIEKELTIASGESVTLQFTPHLVPMERGILSSCYAKAKKGVTGEEIRNAFNKYYADEYFIRLIDAPAETRNVKGSNSVDIFPAFDERTGNVMVFSALDNLIKGAAGQAVQNMNILFDLDEKTGLCKVGKDWI